MECVRRAVAVDDGTGDAEASSGNTFGCGKAESVAGEFFDQVFKAGKITCGVAFASDDRKFLTSLVVGDEVGLGAANVSRDEHGPKG